MQRSGGFRRKTRYKLQRAYGERGTYHIRDHFQVFQLGDRVLLKAQPAYQNGMYFPRYHGKTGTIVSKQGDCYKLTIWDENKQKALIVHPVHLRKQL